MPDLQCYPWNLHLIKNVKYTVVFLTWKVFISDNFPLLFINNKNASQLVIEPANENKQFKETKKWILYLILYLIRQSFKIGNCHLCMESLWELICQNFRFHSVCPIFPYWVVLPLTKRPGKQWHWPSRSDLGQFLEWSGAWLDVFWIGWEDMGCQEKHGMTLPASWRQAGSTSVLY